MVWRFAARWSTLIDPPAWLAFSFQKQHACFQRRESHRRIALWIDRLRRVHLRKTNACLEADVPRARADGVSVFCGERHRALCDRRSRDGGAISVSRVAV